MGRLTHNQFQNLANKLFSHLKEDEKLSLSLNGEETRFLRFNQSRIRQASAVEQIQFSLTLQWESRELSSSFFAGVDEKTNNELCQQVLEQLRQEIQHLPIDPYFVGFKNHGVSENIFEAPELPLSNLEKLCLENLAHIDLAGIYCDGPQYKGLMNSEGLDHWFSSTHFFFDYSLYHGHKAVKGGYAGSHWKQEEFLQRIEENKFFLEKLKAPSKKIAPGKYRTYLAPAATHEIFSTLGWGGFGYGAFKRGQSSLGKLYHQEKQLSPKLTISENLQSGLVPQFNEIGELAPGELILVNQGIGVEQLKSSRTAKEYEVDGNAASEGEAYRSPKVFPGTLKHEDILKELGEGLYLSNLHYLNYSDVPGGRITGMTRYACFWVENGEIQAPIEDLRFDESVYQCLGENLVNLTQETEVFPETSTYFSRHFGSAEMPGVLIDAFTFTL